MIDECLQHVVIELAQEVAFPVVTATMREFGIERLLPFDIGHGSIKSTNGVPKARSGATTSAPVAGSPGQHTAIAIMRMPDSASVAIST